jgi:glycosyltransferase involved in cell wall biosynthesis
LNKKIKVLHIISSLGQGGAERQLVELVKHNKNHAICQLIPGGVYEKELKKKKIIIFNLKLKKNIFSLFELYRLHKIIKYYKPNIINTWMYHSCLLEAALRKITFNKIPLIWGLRCSNMETSYYSKTLKIVINGCKYFSKTPNIIINNSMAGMNFHKSIGFKNNNIVIFNGVDTKKFSLNSKFRNQFRNKFNIAKDAKVLLCVGRVDPMKDHATLLEAFIKIKENFSTVVLILAGLGTENINKTSGLITLGSCQDIDHVYSACDIIISSSAFGEGFSNSLAEGMSSSLIPIATDVGDAKHIVGNTGKIIKPKNVLELYNAIKELLELDEKNFVTNKILAKNRINKNFNQLKMINSYDEIYNKLLEE